MLFLAAAAALAPTPQNAPVAPVRATVQAQAIVRIITGATIRLGEGALSGDAPPAQPTTAHTDAGTQPARLIEFQ